MEGCALNININDTRIGSLLDYSSLNIWAEKTDEKIRSTFGQKPAAALQLSREGRSAAKNVKSGQTSTSAAVQQKAATGKEAPWVKRDLVRTGYASIDNTIIDSLDGVSHEVRQYAYDIVRNDFLLDNAEGISEDERQDLISLGLAEAQFVADNYLSGDHAGAFMTAMNQVARIAADGTREEDGTMDYGGIYCRNVTQNGYTVEVTDSFAVLKRYRPEVYRELKALGKEYKKSRDRDLFADGVKLFLTAINELAREQPDAFMEFERDGLRRLEKTSDINVKNTFRHLETKGTRNFLQALMQMQKSGAFLTFPTLTNRFDTIIRQINPHGVFSDQ